MSIPDILNNYYWLLPIIGFIIGLFAAMVGGGGAFFFIPILTLFYGIDPNVAVSTSLAATLPICLIGSIGHYKKGHTDTQIAGIFVMVGAAGVLLGSFLSGQLTSESLGVIFGVYSLLMAGYILVRRNRVESAKNLGQNISKDLTKSQKLKGSFFGLFAGLVTGTIGVNGTAPVVAGLMGMDLRIKKVIGTAIIIVLGNTLIGIIAHFFIHKFDLNILLLLTLGSTIGAFIGPGIISRFLMEKQGNSFRFLYVIVLVIIGVLMIIN